jgi:hypothetical protein
MSLQASEDSDFSSDRVAMNQKWRFCVEEVYTRARNTHTRIYALCTRHAHFFLMHYLYSPTVACPKLSQSDELQPLHHCFGAVLLLSYDGHVKEVDYFLPISEIVTPPLTFNPERKGERNLPPAVFQPHRLHHERCDIEFESVLIWTFTLIRVVILIRGLS